MIESKSFDKNKRRVMPPKISLRLGATVTPAQTLVSDAPSPPSANAFATRWSSDLSAWRATSRSRAAYHPFYAASFESGKAQR
jgi:hypothetical protein